MAKKTIADLGDLKGKRVLVRVDFNVPLDKKTGAVKNDRRIRAALPTVKALLSAGASVIAMSHLGRPEKATPEERANLKLDKVAARFGELLGVPVQKAADDVVGPAVEAAVQALPAGGVMLNWTLGMTLLLHPLDYTRSLTPWVQALRGPLGSAECLAAPGMQMAYVAALEAQGRWRIDARHDALDTTACPILLLTESRDGGVPEVAGWVFSERVRRPTERYFATLVYRRSASAGAPERPAGAD